VTTLVAEGLLGNNMNKARTQTTLCFGALGLIAGCLLFAVAGVGGSDLWYSSSEHWTRPTFLHFVVANLFGIIAAWLGGMIAVRQGWISDSLKRSVSRIALALGIIGIINPIAFLFGNDIALYPMSVIMSSTLLSLSISCGLWVLSRVWSTATASAMLLFLLTGPNIALVWDLSATQFAYPVILTLVVACVGFWLALASDNLSSRNTGRETMKI
jgi:hypothetical protein